MADQQFKRNIAYKLRIGDILIGKPIFDAERFIFLELGDKKIVRINLVANIVDKFESEGEKKFIVFTVDDGSGQIKMRAFAEDVEKFKDFSQGQTILVIGVVRSFNNELYILPEIIREQEQKYLLLRKLETEKTKNIPIALLTNLSDNNSREEGKKLGAIDYVVKTGISLKELIQMAKEVIKS